MHDRIVELAEALADGRLDKTKALDVLQEEIEQGLEDDRFESLCRLMSESIRERPFFSTSLGELCYVAAKQRAISTDLLVGVTSNLGAAYHRYCQLELRRSILTTIWCGSGNPNPHISWSFSLFPAQLDSTRSR